MKASTTFIVYLNTSVICERYSYLHRFLHPGILEEDKKAALLCFSMDNSYHALLSLKVRDFSVGKNSMIHIPGAIVDAIIEIPAAQNKFGFHRSEASTDALHRNLDGPCITP